MIFHAGVAASLAPKKRRQTRIGLVAGGLAAYWPQFPDLLPQLQRSSAYVTSRFAALDAEVIDVGFISDARRRMSPPKSCAWPAATSS